MKSNRVTRDSVITDLENVNELAVRLNSEKVDLVNRIGSQNQQVEQLQDELIKLREELLGAMAQLEDERHRASTLQRLVTNSSTQKHKNFVTEPMRKKPVTALAGVGEVLGKKLKSKGLEKAEDVFAQFLIMKKKQEQI